MAFPNFTPLNRWQTNTPILETEDDIALNQAILDSLQPTANRYNTNTISPIEQQPRDLVPIGIGPRINIPVVPQPTVRVPNLQQTVSRGSNFQTPGRIQNLPQLNTQQPNVRMPNLKQQNVRVPTLQQTTGRTQNLPQLNIQQPNVRVPNLSQLNPHVPNLPQPNVRVPNLPQPNPRVPNLLQSDPRIPNVPQPNAQQRNLPMITPVQRIQIPTIPPLATNILQTSPRRTFTPVRTGELSPPRPRSPGRMTPEEENQMRIAIMASLQDTGHQTQMPVIIRTPPHSPRLTPIENELDEDLEDTLMQEAIRASLEATEQAQLATFYANQVVVAPASPRPMSPPNQTKTDRQLREEQDHLYEETERIDRQKFENARLAAEASTRAAIAAEDASRALQQAQIAENAKRESLQPPTLEYPLETSDVKDIFMLRFRLPNGMIVNHSFNNNEPLSSVIQQLRFDLKYIGNLTLTAQDQNSVLTCDLDTSISACGIRNRIAINVSYQ